MAEPQADEAADAESWPRLPTPPRRFEHGDSLLDLAGDGNREFLVTIAFFFLGFVAFVPLFDVYGLPAPLVILGALLGLGVGKLVNRRALRAVLRDGIEARGEIVKFVDHGQHRTFIYQYFVNGIASRHDVTHQSPEIVALLEIGMPVLVIHDRRRIGRHVAFFPPRFAELRALLGHRVAPAPVISDSPYRDNLSATTRRQLPVAPRSVPAGTRRILGLISIPRLLVVNAIFVALLLALALVAQQGLVEPASPLLWIPGVVVLGNLLLGTIGLPLLTGAMLRRGIETTGTITSIEPHGGRLRVTVRYMVGDQARDWGVLIAPNDLAVAVGDTVPVLVSTSAVVLRMCVPFVTHQARALLERWRTET